MKILNLIVFFFTSLALIYGQENSNISIIKDIPLAEILAEIDNGATEYNIDFENLLNTYYNTVDLTFYVQSIYRNEVENNSSTNFAITCDLNVTGDNNTGINSIQQFPINLGNFGNETSIPCPGIYSNYLVNLSNFNIPTLTTDIIAKTFVRLEIRGKVNAEMNEISYHSIQSDNLNNLLKIYWSPIIGADVYEVEYYFKNESDQEQFIWTSKKQLKFITNYNNYTIPLVYPEGQLFVRIRGYNEHTLSVNDLHYTAWLELSPVTTNLFETKTWNGQKQFAEEGKYKASVTFFDQYNRPTQNTTNINDHHQVLRSEAFYDAEGRSAMQIVPVPDIEGLTFNQDFNRNTDGETIDIVEIESGLPLSPMHGASKYYSENNSTDGVHNEFIPNANGYPYTLQKYSQDQLGKVIETSGLGETFNINEEHTVNTYYSKATISEIQKLFGREIGDAKGFMKVVTKDPNGQYSASYYNRQGQVVATSLLNGAPSNVLVLSNITNTIDFTQALTTGELNDNEIYSTNSFIITNESGLNFNYTFNLGRSSLACGEGLQSGFCYSCAYEVEFSLIDPCGAEVPFFSFNSSKGTIENINEKRIVSIGPDSIEDGICADENGPGGDPLSATNIDIQFTANVIVEGEYILVKKIKALEPSSEVLENAAMCGIDVQAITDYYYDQILEEDCFYDYTEVCTEQVKEENPGLTEDSQEFQNLVLDCLNNAVNLNSEQSVITEEEFCENTRAVLIASLNPFICEDYDVSLVAPDFMNVEFKIIDFEGAEYLWNGIKLVDIDEQLEGQFAEGVTIDLIGLNNEIENFNLSDEVSLKMLFESVNYWQTQFADYLLDQGGHIQACKLINCASYYQQSLFLDQINNSSYSGLLNQYGLTGYDITNETIDQAFVDAIIANDPIDLIGDCSNAGFTLFLEEQIQEVDNFEEICTTQNCDFVGFIKALSETIGNQVKISEFLLFKSYYNRFRAAYLYNCSECAPQIPCGGYPEIEDELITNVDDLINGFFQNPKLESCENNIINYVNSIIEVFHAEDTDEMKKSKYDAYMADEELIRNLEYVCTEICNPWNTSVAIPNESLNSFPAVLSLDDCFDSNELIYKVDRPNSIFLKLLEQEGGFSKSCFSPEINEVVLGKTISFDILDNQSSIDNQIFRYVINPTVFDLPVNNINEFLSRLNVSVYASSNCLLDDDSLVELDCNFELNYHKKLIGEVVIPNDKKYDKLIISFSKLQLNNTVLNNNVENIEFRFKFDYRKQISKYFGSRAKVNLFSLENLIQFFNTNYNFFDGSESDDVKIESFLKNIWNCNAVCATEVDCIEEVLEAADGLISVNFENNYENETEVFCNEINYNLSYKSPYFKSLYLNRHTDLIEDIDDYFGQLTISNNLFCDEDHIIRIFSEEGNYYFPSTYSHNNIQTSVQIIDVEPTIIPFELVNKYKFEDVQFSGYYGLIREKYNMLDTSLAETYELDQYLRVYFLIESKDGECGSLVSPCEIDINYDLYKEECIEQLQEQADYNISVEIQNQLNKNLEKLKGNINCFENIDESLTYSSTYQEYHHTLYYYDRAGNVIKTIPPAGVVPFGEDMFKDGKLIPSAPNAPPHLENHFTTYKYNALNQLVESNSKDRGITTIEYDYYGRPRKTTTGELVVFNKYDDLNRVIEYGEPSDAIVINDFDTPTLKEGVQVFYEEHAGNIIQQDNLRNKISYTKRIHFDETYNKEEEEIYSYDTHGNVKTKAVSSFLLGNKVMEYDYDLISGNVKTFSYNKTEPDKFFHKYTYDGDNRLKSAFSSSDGFYWDEDAKYEYYDHGPLGRLELGEEKVQGLDYMYTMQGWIKGVNFVGDGDISQDGFNEAYNPNGYFASDAFGYLLQYHKDDYEPITGNLNLTQDGFYNDIKSQLVGNEGLYNGNIVGMAVESNGNQFARTYRYDQLHRIIRSFTYHDDNMGGFYFGNDFNTLYNYDPNGNLKNLKRQNEGTPYKDDLRYYYDTDIPNRLNRVRDWSSDTQVNTFQGIETYKYNDRGNITKIVQKNVNIDWNFDDKVKQVQNPQGTTQFIYSPSGQRNAKIQEETSTYWKGQYYVRDASDNVLAIYDFTKLKDGGWEENKRKEAYIYGSSRLGVDKSVIDLDPDIPLLDLYTRSRLAKSYELSNHLGNVYTIIADGKEAKEENGALAYDAVVLSTSDYYPFGQEILQGKGSNSSTYRYGFNGKEKDEDGEFSDLTHYDYGFRIYNPSIGKFLSVDPLTRSYPMLTPYQFASNSPIMANDVDGLEGIAGYLMNKFVLPEKYRVSPENMTRLKSAYDIEENTWSEWVFDFMSGTLQGAMDSNDPMSYVNGIVNMYQSSSEDFMAGWTGMDAEGCELTKTERSIALLQGVIPASDMVDQTVDDFILAVEGDGEAAARLTLQAFDIAMGLRAKGGFKKTEAQKSNAVNQGTKDAQNSKAPFRFSSKSERWHGPDGKFIGKPKASQLRDWAKSQGWELQKITDAGFETWVDEAGTKRMKIKPASTQSGVGPWSREPRVTIRDKNGITVDGWDNVVIKKSKTTHAPIILD